jgi:hypothetical protein
MGDAQQTGSGLIIGNDGKLSGQSRWQPASAPGRAPRTWERTPIGGSLQVEARSQLPGPPRGMGGARRPW